MGKICVTYRTNQCVHPVYIHIIMSVLSLIKGNKIIKYIKKQRNGFRMSMNKC